MDFTPATPCVPSQMKPPLNAKVIVDAQGLDLVEDFFARKNTFGFDIETNVSKFYHRRIRLIQVGDREEQYLIDLWELAGRDTEYLRTIQGSHGVRMPKDGTFAKLRNTLVPALDSNKYLKIGHGLIFEYITMSWCLGIFPWNFWDTLLAEKVRWAGEVDFFENNFWGLEDVARRYLKIEISKGEQKGFWPEGGPTPLTQEQIDYGALDVRIPCPIRQGQQQMLMQQGLLPTIELENNAVPAFGDMHVNGFYCDVPMWYEQIEKTKKRHAENVAALDEEFIAQTNVGEKGTAPTVEELKQLEDKWQDYGVPSEREKEIIQQLKEAKGKEAKDALREVRNKLEEERKELRAKAREKFRAACKQVTWYRNEADKMEGRAMINYGSSKQLLLALHQIKGLNETTLKDTKDKTLLKLAKRFPICKKLTDYRETNKLLGTYGEEYIKKHVNPDTGRIHAEFNQIGAATGRSSCEDPNLQQIPVVVDKETKIAMWRACFRAMQGKKIVTRDLEGCELRIMAEASGEQSWIDALNNGDDLHELTAMNIAERLEPGSWFKMGEPDCQFAVTKKQCECFEHKKKRKEAKIINFGIAYGKTVYGVMEELGCDEATATLILEAWHASNPVLSAFLRKTGEDAKMYGTARTLIGRIRKFKVNSRNPNNMAVAKVKLLAEWKRKKWDKNADGTPRFPTHNQVTNMMIRMLAATQREGSNHPIQGSNADLVKIAVGCGYDKENKPFLWHYTRPDKNFALLENLVHDELVLEAADEHAEEADRLTDDCLQRAGAVFVKRLRMTTDGKVKEYWAK